MLADAYLSYIRFHHEKTRLVDFEIKLPPRADQQRGERRKRRKRENERKRGVEAREDEQDEEEKSKARERTKPGTLNLEGLSRTT